MSNKVNPSANPSGETKPAFVYYVRIKDSLLAAEMQAMQQAARLFEHSGTGSLFFGAFDNAPLAVDEFLQIVSNPNWEVEASPWSPADPMMQLYV